MTAFRYFRLNITSWADAGSSGGTTGYVRIAELQILDAADIAHPVVKMTGDNAPSPLSASASSLYSAGFEAFRAFDGIESDAGRWISGGSGPQWLQIDLGEGNAVRVSKIKITTDGQHSSYIVAFNLVGSNTGAFAGEEVLLVSQSGLTSGWSVLTARTFDVPPLFSVSGVVRDDSGNPVQRVVRAYRRDTGALLASTVSSDGVGGTGDPGPPGSYNFTLSYGGEVQVVCLDDAAGTTYNDQIARTTPV